MSRKAYITKRVLERAVGAAMRRASQEAMDTVGYVIKAADGWVVKVDQHGNHTRLSRIQPVNRPAHLILD